MAISTPPENRHIAGPLRLPILPYLAAWSRSGPEKSRKGSIAGEHALAWSAWQAYLAQREHPRPLGELLPSRTPPLAWALAEIPGIEDVDALRSRLAAILRTAGNNTSPDTSPKRKRGTQPRPSLALRASVPAGVGRAERLLDQWLGEAQGPCRDCGRALEALAWCHALPGACQWLAPDTWWQLLQGLLLLAGEAGTSGLAEEPLLNQLLAGELRFTLACLLPEIEACRELAGPARASLSTGLVDLLDGEGTPHGKYLGLLRPLLACWTRVLALAIPPAAASSTSPKRKRGTQPAPSLALRAGIALPWSDAAQVQYQWLVQGALRLSRCDGAHVFSTRPATGRSRAAAGDADLLEAALQLGGNQQDWAIARRCFTRRTRHAPRGAIPLAEREEYAISLVEREEYAIPLAEREEYRKRGTALTGDSNRRPAKPGKAPGLPAPATHGEWAGVSVLRSGWSAADPRLVAVYHDESVRIEIGCRKEVFWSGQWGLEVLQDGQPLRPIGPWEEICWESAGGVDYLELAIDLGSGVRVERHLALAGKDNFVFLADAILGSRAARLEYRGWLRLAPGMSLVAAESSREGFVEGRGQKALVLPLALPEWRIDTRPGTLAAVEDRIELWQSATGSALFAPLFVDLDRRRMARPYTWRQLAVGENLAMQPPDVAVGYRVMVGRQQWLIYRSLAPAANRSLLGHNLVSGMLLARFDRRGKVESLVEIE